MIRKWPGLIGGVRTVGPAGGETNGEEVKSEGVALKVEKLAQEL